MRKVKIKVKQKHIDKGVRSSSSCCHIALAMKDKGYTDVYVDYFGMTYETKKYEWAGELPSEAKKFIEHFDDEEKVEPFEFEANVVTYFDF